METEMGTRTRDGINIRTIVKALEQIVGVEIKPGTKHPYIAKMQGYPQPCPIAASTDAKRMVVPWVRHSHEYENMRSREIYQALRSGEWN